MTVERVSRRNPAFPRFTRAPEIVLAAAIVAIAGLSAVMTPGFAQDINDAVTFEDLGFTQRLCVGARAAGMGGAYVAAGDDVHSLIYNPAGLARVRRIDVSLGFQYDRTSLDEVFYGNTNQTDFSSMNLDAVAVAYPVPTYRGSLVVAGGVYRIMTSQLDILNRGFNTTTDTYDDYLLQQSGSSYSYNLGVGVDLSPSVSVGLNGYIIDGTIKALTQFTVDYPTPLPDGLESYSVRDDAELDLDGYGLTLGLQYSPHRLAHIGLTVTTPVSIKLDGGAITETAEYYTTPPDEFFTEQFFIDQDYTIPFRIDGGVSFTSDRLVLSLDAGYSDWAQAKVNDVALKDENLNAIFRSVLDVRVGGELVLPVVPIRVRAGYALTPYALEYLQGDRIGQNDIRKAHIDTERQSVAAGIGVLLGDVLTVDASYEYQTGKRSIDTLTDERKTERVVLTGSYRF